MIDERAHTSSALSAEMTGRIVAGEKVGRMPIPTGARPRGRSDHLGKLDPSSWKLPDPTTRAPFLNAAGPDFARGPATRPGVVQRWGWNQDTGVMSLFSWRIRCPASPLLAM
jgi:hypothetical protein